MDGRSLMLKLVYSLVIAVFIGYAFQAPAEIYLAPEFSPSGTVSVTSGQSYNLDIIMSIRSPGEIVSAYDLDVLYNRSILIPTSVSFGGALGSVASYELFQGSSFAVSGVANLKAVSLLADSDLVALQSGMGGNILLATLTFTAVANGTDTLAYDWGLTSRGLRDVKGSNNTAYTVVPEPSSYLLALIAGVGVAAAIRLSRRAPRNTPLS